MSCIDRKVCIYVGWKWAAYLLYLVNQCIHTPIHALPPGKPARRAILACGNVVYYAGEAIYVWYTYCISSPILRYMASHLFCDQRTLPSLSRVAVPQYDLFLPHARHSLWWATISIQMGNKPGSMIHYEKVETRPFLCAPLHCLNACCKVHHIIKNTIQNSTTSAKHERFIHITKYREDQVWT